MFKYFSLCGHACCLPRPSLPCLTLLFFLEDSFPAPTMTSRSDSSRKRMRREKEDESDDDIEQSEPKRSKLSGEEEDPFKGLIMPVLITYARAQGIRVNKTRRATLVADLVSAGVTRSDVEVRPCSVFPTPSAHTCVLYRVAANPRKPRRTSKRRRS